MDNISHSLVGLATADALTQGRFSHVKKPALVLAVIASNFPDLDSLYTPFFSGDFGYLLHHRGHTHTFLGLVPQALLILGFFFLWWRPKPQPNNAGANIYFLASIVALCLVLHLFLDYWNIYGVHPFWPWNNHWYALDAIFILEPLIWIGLALALGLKATNKYFRIFCGSIVAGALGLLWFVDLVPVAAAITYSAFAIVAAISFWKIAPAWRSTSALALVSMFLIVMTALSLQAKREVHSIAVKIFPDFEIHETVVGPLPADPRCWWIALIGKTANDQYQVKMGEWRLMQGNSFCSAGYAGELGIQLEDISEIGAEKTGLGTVAWRRQFSAPMSLMREQANSDCRFAAFLIFAKVPFLQSAPNSSEMLYGDLRFTRSKNRSFSEFSTQAGNTLCPGNLPPWEPPLKRLVFN